jgi:hypothetical protein
MFPRKSGYRTITVSGERYKWVAGGNGDINCCKLSMGVRSISGGGSKLNVYFSDLLAPIPWPIDDYVEESPLYKKEDGLYFRRVGVVLPSHVARAISKALDKGWRPEEKEKPFQLTESYEEYEIPIHWEVTYNRVDKKQL